MAQRRKRYCYYLEPHTNSQIPRATKCYINKMDNQSSSNICSEDCSTASSRQQKNDNDHIQKRFKSGQVFEDVHEQNQLMSTLEKSECFSFTDTLCSSEGNNTLCSPAEIAIAPGEDSPLHFGSDSPLHSDSDSPLHSDSDSPLHSDSDNPLHSDSDNPLHYGSDSTLAADVGSPLRPGLDSSVNSCDSSPRISECFYGSSFSSEGSNLSESDYNISHEKYFDDIEYVEPTEQLPPKILHLEETVLPNLKITKFECLLMILHITLRHGLSIVAIHDILKFVNCVLGGEVIPQSFYHFNKLFQGDIKPEFHFYCLSCGAGIEKLSNADELIVVKCQVCGKDCDMKSMNDGCFFVTMPLERQLRSLFEGKANILDLLAYRFKRSVETNCYGDIFDGSHYRELAHDILDDVNNISITVNTDGSPVFCSVKNTMWPIQFRINEMPPQERFLSENMMVAGLWFGKKEPNMPLFLKPFLKEANDLQNKGFIWCHCDEVIHSKVVILNCVLDSVAKPTVQNTTQFNGYYGCGYCYHPGKMLEKNGRSHLRYSASEIYPERTDAEIRNDMLASHAQGTPVRGVKDVSSLIILPRFDLVFGFVIDYMHAVLLGVTKLTVNLWCDTQFNRESFYIGRKTNEIDSGLLNIKPPLYISRRPRSISERIHWKANEWRAWLLHYSLPCLNGILPGKYLKHHCLLVSAVYLLLKSSLSNSELDCAKLYLLQYVKKFEELYGEFNMKFNVHLLLHLGTNVEFLGPLWCYSAFPFESGNGSLVKLVKGTRGVATQIARKYLMLKAVPKCLLLYNVSENVVKYCSLLMSQPETRNVTRCADGTVLLGQPAVIPLSAEQETLLKLHGLEASQFCYHRFIKKSVKYHSRTYRKCRKSDDSAVFLRDGGVGHIERIVTSTNLSFLKAFIILRDISIERNENIVVDATGASAHHIKVCSSYIYGSMRLLPVDYVSHKAILMVLPNGSYVSSFPNSYEKD